MRGKVLSVSAGDWIEKGRLKSESRLRRRQAVFKEEVAFKEARKQDGGLLYFTRFRGLCERILALLRQRLDPSCGIFVFARG
jgi:16S rRNA G1207 methylase RsmC